MYETICAQACRHPDKNYIFLVPEQATLQVQRELSAVHPDHVLGNIDVDELWQTGTSSLE